MRNFAKLLLLLILFASSTFSSHALAPELLIGIREFNHGKGARAIAFSPFGDAVMTVAGSEARLWEIPKTTRPIVYQHSKNINGAFFDPSGDWLIISTENGELITWDIGTGTQLGTVKFSKPVSAISISKNGDYYAVSSEKNVYVFNSQKKTIYKKWKLPYIVTSLDFAPVGDDLAIGSGRNIYIKDLSSITSNDVTIRHTRILTNVKFSPYGDMIAAIQGQDVIIWDTLTKAKLSVLTHKSPVADISFDLENDELISASGDQVTFWNVLSQQEMKKFTHPGEIKTIAVSPDGEMILSTSIKSSVRLWRIIK